MAAKDMTQVNEFSENALLCGICAERYKTAKVLPCLHSFCEPCLGKLAEKNGAVSVTCPICRRSHELPGGSVADFEDNAFLGDLLEMFKSQGAQPGTGKCEGCGQGDLAKHCIECSMAFCGSCVATHRQIPVTKSHRTLSPDEYRAAKFANPASVHPPIFCSKHPSYEIEVYCDTCEEAVCQKCTAWNHPVTEHKCRCVGEAAEEFTRDLTAMMDRVKTKESEADESKAAIAVVLESLDTRFRREQSKIKEYVDNAVRETTNRIRERGDELLKELKVEYDLRTENLNAQVKNLDISENDLSYAREYVETVANYGTKAQLMSSKVRIAAKIEELMKVETRCDPVEDDYIEFKPNDDFCNVETIGAVLTNAYKLSDVPANARVGEDIVCTLVPSGETLPGDAGRQDVHAVLEAPDGSIQPARGGTDHGNGLTLTTAAKVAGEHQLSVSVNKKMAQGSPVRIKVVPQKGLVLSFGGLGSQVGRLRSPYGIKMTRNEDALVCDHANSRLQIFSVGENYQQRVVQCVSFQNTLPNDVALSQDGNVYMTDEANKLVVVYDVNDKTIRRFGQGQIATPVGIAVSPVNGAVYVVDNGAHCIHIYNQVGNRVKSFGNQGMKAGEFQLPWFICIDGKGNVYVSDTCNHRIQVFDSDGHFLYTFGSEGRGDGQLFRPRGVAVDKHGYVYVSDKGNNRIVKYESGGKFVCRIDRDEDGLNGPYGICVTGDDHHSKIWVSDHGNNCLKVFAQ